MSEVQVGALASALRDVTRNGVIVEVSPAGGDTAESVVLTMPGAWRIEFGAGTMGAHAIPLPPV